MIQQLNAYLQEFRTLANHQNNAYRWQYVYDGQQSTFRIQICGIIHGNEVGSLPALLDLMRSLESGEVEFPGVISIVLGNPEAAKLNQRFVEADLNRLFLDPQPKSKVDTHEAQRARTLMPILSKCDILLDLHQTMLASHQAFFICPRSEISIAWANSLNGTRAYIDSTPTTHPPTYQCSDDFIWHQDKPALTLELGEAGFHQPAKDVSKMVIANLLATATRLIEQGIEHDRSQTLASLNTIPNQLIEHRTVHREPYHTASHALRPNIINFQPVVKGELVNETGTPIMSIPEDGFILFPKYPRRDDSGQICEDLPKEIFRIIQPC